MTSFLKSPLQLYHNALVLFFILCALFGGASNEGGNIHAIFSLMAAVMLIFPLFILKESYRSENSRAVLIFAFLALLLISLQLVPLPYAVWEGLPDRDIIVATARLIGEKLSYTPITFTPARTVISASMFILPTLIIMTLTVRHGQIHRNTKLLFVPAVALMSAVLGGIQILTHGFQIYDYATPGLPIGLFSNANHQATSMLMAIPFIAAAHWRLDRLQNRGRFHYAFQFGLISLFVLLIAIILGVKSLAGFLILCPILVLSGLLLMTDKLNLTKRQWRIIFTACFIFSVVFLLLIETTNFTALNFDSSKFSRLDVLSVLKEVVRTHFLYGTGLGSFEDVFRLYERSADVSATYINHAHNDYVEWIMEMGVLGFALLLSFLIWLAYKVFKIWTANVSFEIVLARAASVSLLVVIVHSVVDYPLRTYTITILASFCLGIILGAKCFNFQKITPRNWARPL